MPRVEHPWGSEETWAETSRYVARTILLRAGASTGTLRHPARDKTLRVQRGRVLVLVDPERSSESCELRAGEWMHLVAGAPHALSALTDAEIVEVSTPEPISAGTAVEVPDPDIIIDDAEEVVESPPAFAVPLPAVAHENAKVVLVVEDDLPIQDILVRGIGTRFTVYRADDGIQALALLRALPKIDLIVTDLAMPRLNGLDLMHHLRADLTKNKIPIIVLTARTTSKDVALAINAGARSFIPKPFKLKELLSLIDKALAPRG
jgi:CheY-like chemotaxis protein/mannose-6-phosphate isomerase-like protein (cupin superfamily)